jgi:hypothetical protein
MMMISAVHDFRSYTPASAPRRRITPESHSPGQIGLLALAHTVRTDPTSAVGGIAATNKTQKKTRTRCRYLMIFPFAQISSRVARGYPASTPRTIQIFLDMTLPPRLNLLSSSTRVLWRSYDVPERASACVAPRRCGDFLDV